MESNHTPKVEPGEVGHTPSLLDALKLARKILHRPCVRNCCVGPAQGGFDAAEVRQIDAAIDAAEGRPS